MRSPFPGMDPYLEGYLWADVHQRLATRISIDLSPQLLPNYVARLAISIKQDSSAQTEVGIMYPDPATNFQMRLVTVDVRDIAQNQLVTSIEIISPVNKREPGLTDYRQKQQELAQAGVHLLEIDLLRRGQRPQAQNPSLPTADYLITLTRARTTKLEVWPIMLPDPLPVVAVPLRHPDKDIALDLGSVLRTIYAEARYDMSLDYIQLPTPPQLSKENLLWLKDLLSI